MNRRTHSTRSTRRSGRHSSRRAVERLETGTERLETGTERPAGADEATGDEAGTRSDRAPRRTQAERRERTRRALLDAALEQMDGGNGIDSLSLRRVTKAAGIVPGAFYRHFADMDELGLALVEESVLALRSMLREARADGPAPERLIQRSVAILVDHVRRHRQHFAFMAHARASGNAVLRHAIRAETKLFASELATDLARFPVLREWTTEDLQMLAGLYVDTMISTIDAMLEASSWGAGGGSLSAEAEARIRRLAEKQLRLVMLAIPHWRSRP